MTPTVDGEAAERQQHWESVYAEKDTTKVGWFESTPSFSLVMCDAIGADPSMAVIDVGAGASRLAAALLKRGFSDVTALDIADEGLAAARRELGPDAYKITWVTADPHGVRLRHRQDPHAPWSTPSVVSDTAAGSPPH